MLASPVGHKHDLFLDWVINLTRSDQITWTVGTAKAQIRSAPNVPCLKAEFEGHVVRLIIDPPIRQLNAFTRHFRLKITWPDTGTIAIEKLLYYSDEDCLILTPEGFSDRTQCGVDQLYHLIQALVRPQVV